MKKVGVIGGMGPEATVDFYNKIIASTKASCDQEHIPLLIDICPQIPDRSQYLLADGDDPLPVLLNSSQMLIKANVSAICMPCNTAHYFAQAIREQISIPLISIIDCVLDDIKTNYPNTQRIGLLATAGTISSGVYHHAFIEENLKIIPLSDDFQSRVMKIIYSIKSGDKQSVITDFQSCINELVEQGADIIITGCTELPLLVPDVTINIPTIDPTALLAEAVVKFSQG